MQCKAKAGCSRSKVPMNLQEPHCSHCGKAWVCFGMLMRHPVTSAYVKAQSYLIYSRNLSNSIIPNFIASLLCWSIYVQFHLKYIKSLKLVPCLVFTVKQYRLDHREWCSLVQAQTVSHENFFMEMVFSYQNCSSDREIFLKFEAEGWEFEIFLSSLEQFVQTVKGQTNFGNIMLF